MSECFLALQIICVPFQARPSSLNQHRKISYDSVPASIFLDQDNKLIETAKVNKWCFSKNNEFNSLVVRFPAVILVNLENDVVPV